MNKLALVVLSLCLAASSALAMAGDSMSMKKDAMGKEAMSKDSMKKGAMNDSSMSGDAMRKKEPMHKDREDSMKMKARTDRDKGM
jgi:pentapeptide MXKDX repeat protein